MKSTINIKELDNLIATDPSLQLIDVRSPGEYAAGHVPRAINIPLEEVEARINDLGASHVAVLCQSGNRASMACEILQEHHKGLLLVEGGTQAWIDAGKPVAASSATRWALERQVRLIAGMMVLIGSILAVTVNPAWVYLAMFVGAGLTFAGATNVCGMAFLLAKLPWNRPAACSKNLTEVKA